MRALVGSSPEKWRSGAPAYVLIAYPGLKPGATNISSPWDGMHMSSSVTYCSQSIYSSLSVCAGFALEVRNV
jgi:hypothetical protein